uniref:Uncharacterized protein n=1 Tax=Rhodococcus hoagii TaxID=43767 RepID=Q9ETI5_RHOHA|nr:unknown [Prescottella equi]BAB16638.1 hypothetical protein [Prescottella equi]
MTCQGDTAPKCGTPRERREPIHCGLWPRLRMRRHAAPSDRTPPRTFARTCAESGSVCWRVSPSSRSWLARSMRLPRNSRSWMPLSSHARPLPSGRSSSW